MKSKQIVGSFEIGNTIGQGTFGKVKLGKHVLTEENVVEVVTQVAIKIFEKERMERPSELRRIVKEINILKQLRHPHIIRIYEIVETPGQIYLIMEYVEKGELFDYIKQNKKLTERMAARLYSQLISAMEYMHSENVVHRDLKPENILLTSTMDIKIVDFGLSTHFTGGEKLKSSCGSPCYALPEMLVGGKYEASEADIWSAGVVLFTMVCGYLPFEDTDIKKLYRKVMSQQLEFPEDCSGDVRDLLKSILHKNREARYSLNQIKYHKWLRRNSKEQQQRCQQKPQEKWSERQIDAAVLSQMEIYGVEATYVKGCLQSDKYNFATTLYYLLQRKMAREGGLNFFTNCSTALSIKEKLARESDAFEQQNELPTLRSEINNGWQSEDKDGFGGQSSTISPRKKRTSNKVDNRSTSPLRMKSKQHTNSHKQLQLKSALKTQTSRRSNNPSTLHKTAKKCDRHDEYFVGRKSKDRQSKKKVSMYERVESETTNNIGNEQYERMPMQKERKLTKHRPKN